MRVLATSRTYMYITIDPPPWIGDITALPDPPEAALIADDGTEPADGDYHTAIWLRGQVALLIGPGGNGAIAYTAGDYFAFARITAGAEQVVLPSGRVRIGM
jgi:hypothetical protein